MVKFRSKKINNVTKICRICLEESGRFKEISTAKILPMIQYCASIETTINDKLPNKICISCYRLLVKLYAFKKKIERNDRILKVYMKNLRPEHCTPKDILNIAVNEAEINSEQESNENLNINCRRPTQMSINQTRELNKLQIHKRSLRLSRKSKEKAVRVIDEIVNEFKLTDNDPDILPLEKFVNETVVTIESTDIEIGPPPLVPLEQHRIDDNIKVENDILPCESQKSDLFSPTFPLKTEAVNLLQTFSEPEPPPLIPIKPIVDSTILNIIDSTLIPLQCTVCEEKFENLSALKEHKSKSCQSLLLCNICKREFRERKKLIGHLKGHMVKKDYICKICGKKYPNPSTFKIHMRSHTGERPFKCEICNKGFTRWAGVVSHMSSHQQNKPYKCDVCGQKFKIASNLQRHKVLHLDSLPFCCNYCGKTSSQWDNLQLHIRTYHTNERPYLCSSCGKGFVSSTRLTRHMWIHTGHKPYKCMLCSKAYSNSNDLKAHERSHHHQGTGPEEEEKPYPCTICNMRFYHPCRLTKHLKTHQRPFACTLCPKTFSLHTLLDKHLTSKHNSASSEIDNELE